MKTLAILTPTYNRAYILENLYNSLRNQTSFDFKWYIVDDGSTDDTEQKVANFKKDKFDIVFIKKENGGKHTALNSGIEQIEENLTFIVDSDDYLTDDAVETVVGDWGKYKNTQDIGGLSYYKLKNDFSVVGDKYLSQDIVVDTYFNVRINQGINGDKAEVYRTEVLKKHKFPVFEGEKFLSEAIVWSAISESGYKLAFIPKGIYICEYLNDGLTKAGRKKVLENPKGFYLHAKAFMTPKVKWLIRYKYTVMFVATSKFAKITNKRMFEDCYSKMELLLMFPLGISLYYYWKRKYMDL